MKYEPIVYQFRSPDALNFRELGGYRTAGGRTVRRGLLFRGPSTALLTHEEDKADFAAFEIRSILDFRAPFEARKNPDWVPKECRYVRIGGMHFEDGEELDFSPESMRKMEELSRNAGGDLQLFQRLYCLMPFHNPAYQEMFRILESENVPIYFHCTAGKDRTGIGAILILLALGVDRETALDDYEYTNVCRKPIIDEFIRQNIRPGIPEQNLLPVEGVSRQMAAVALDEIEKRYPSYEAYFEAEFGLDAPRLAALREKYLE